MKRIAILGCTGSIGTQTLDIVRRYPDKFTVVAIVANSNYNKIKEIAEEFKPRFVALCDKNCEPISLSYDCDTYVGEDAQSVAASLPYVDTVVCATMGIAGLSGLVSAIKNKKHVAIANKESIVCAGNIVTKLAKDNGVDLIPVDSEHSAVWQCLNAGRKSDVKSIILTASGGPFKDFVSLDQFENVDIAQAVSHPNWKMGKKISVDSATMMNKGLELIEARWLFDCKDIDYIIHPESIIHSMVKYNDGAIIAQISNPSMEIPIQLALSYPDRFPTKTNDFDFSKNLTFRKPNEDLFFFPKLAKFCLKTEKNSALVLNCINEVAVDLFLSGKIRFVDIFTLVRKTFEKYDFIDVNTIDEVLDNCNEVKRKTLTDYKTI